MLPEMFEALARDSAEAIEEAGEAEARFLDQTAANEDTAVQRILDTDREIAERARAIGESGQDAKQAADRPGFKPRVSDDQLTNGLRGWQSERYQFGNEQFLLDRSDFGHILSRHMPDLRDGSIKDPQTFFDRGMSRDDVQDAIRGVLKQNRDTLISRGTNDSYQIVGSYGGRDYVLGLDHGHIGQLYPKPRS
jgi:hypothetical protein